jgi:hypothetical protein
MNGDHDELSEFLGAWMRMPKPGVTNFRASVRAAIP